MMAPMPGCTDSSADADGDAMPGCADLCPSDPEKTAPGACGCGMPDLDADENGTPDCMDDDEPMEPPPVDPDACAVAPLPDDLRQRYDLGAFYTRHASANGVPIVSSDSPADEAMRRACMIVVDFQRGRDDLLPSMLEDRIYFIMMGADEKTVDTPEFRSLGDIDQRARGLGSMRAALCAEESVMCDRSDRWYGESICVHEYSHTMHLGVYTQVDPMFNTRLRAAYDNARSMGLWSNTYADDNTAEYLGEAVQSWYNTNQRARRTPSDGVHNEINTKDELQAYDPMMYELLSDFLPAEPMWRDCYYYEQ
jgi:hypothetical protein